MPSLPIKNALNRMYVYKYAISTGLLKKFSSWYMLRS